MLKLIDCGDRRAKHAVSHEKLDRLYSQRDPILSVRDIAAILKVSQSALTRMLQKAGLQSRGSPIAPRDPDATGTGHPMEARRIPTLTELVPLRSLGQ